MLRPRSDFDTSWKEALEAFFPEAMALLFPEIHAAVDWEHDFEFMDQELRQAIRRARRGLRVVDKLAKGIWSMARGGIRWYSRMPPGSLLRRGRRSLLPGGGSCLPGQSCPIGMRRS